MPRPSSACVLLISASRFSPVNCIPTKVAHAKPWHGSIVFVIGCEPTSREEAMPESNITKIRKVEPPAIYKTKYGKERLAGGRWNMLRVSEFLKAKKTWQTMDDIARFVYGSTNSTHRDNTRK